MYLDLAHPVRGPFRALVGQVAGSGNRYVARRDVAVERWNGMVQGTERCCFDPPPMFVRRVETTRSI